MSTRDQQTARQEGSDIKTGRKRKNTPSKWVKNIAKLRRNSGKEYVSVKTRRRVTSREIGAPCRDGCFDKVSLPVVRTLFSDFWALASYDAQTAYIQKLVQKVNVKRHRPTKTPENPGKAREFNLSYSVVYQDKTFPVCCAGFTSIFGITKNRVLWAIRKKTATDFPVPDQRGRHENARKITGEKAQCVRDHINQLQTLTSHYSRARNPQRRYLESNLTISKLYQSYEQWMTDNHPGIEKVSQNYYHKTFTSEFNIA